MLTKKNCLKALLENHFWWDKYIWWFFHNYTLCSLPKKRMIWYKNEHDSKTRIHFKTSAYSNKKIIKMRMLFESFWRKVDQLKSRDRCSFLWQFTLKYHDFKRQISKTIKSFTQNPWRSINFDIIQSAWFQNELKLSIWLCRIS